MPDVGPYIATHKGGRFYALAGEGGMVMNTNPKNEEMPYGEAKAWQLGYFNECMSGFEHQVASHMMAEGLVEESLVITRTIHDRYHAFKRNPFNEIECSDHYTRAMSSYGTFINACGFSYHGPKGYIGFSPKLSPDDFKAAFTASEGWGSYMQKRTEKEFSCHIKLEYGRLKLRKVIIDLHPDHKANQVYMNFVASEVESALAQNGSTCEVVIRDPIVIKEGEFLFIKII